VATLTIKTADELMALDLQERWRARRAGRETQVSEQVLRAFVDHGGPILAEDIAAAFRDIPAAAVHQAPAAQLRRRIVDRQRARRVQGVHQRRVLPQRPEQHQLPRVEVGGGHRQGNLEIGKARGGNEAGDGVFERLGFEQAGREHAACQIERRDAGDVFAGDRGDLAREPVRCHARRERRRDHRAERRTDQMDDFVAHFRDRAPGTGAGQGFGAAAAADQDELHSPLPWSYLRSMTRLARRLPARS